MKVPALAARVRDETARIRQAPVWDQALLLDRVDRVARVLRTAAETTGRTAADVARFLSWRSTVEQVIRGSGHISFMDLTFLPLETGSMVAAGMAAVTIDATRAWRLISDALLRFFGEHLGGAEPLLIPGQAPEVVSGPPHKLVRESNRA